MQTQVRILSLFAVTLCFLMTMSGCGQHQSTEDKVPVIPVRVQRAESRQSAMLMFALGLVFVSLVLSAQYESYVDPSNY